MLINRRNLLTATSGFCVYALLAELRAATPGLARGLSARSWVQQQGELARGLQTGTLTQQQWHAGVGALAAEVDLEDLAAELRRAHVRDAGAPFGHDPQKRFVAFVDENGESIRLDYALALFDFQADSVITPHAHQFMASAHMVLEGKVRIRTYDRLRDEENALVIRPTADVVGEPGHAAAMTTARDNIHWFTPQSDQAMTLDVIISGLEVGKAPYNIQPVDPLGGTQLPDGTIRAPLMSFKDSMALYDASR